MQACALIGQVCQHTLPGLDNVHIKVCPIQITKSRNITTRHKQLRFAGLSLCCFSIPLLNCTPSPLRWCIVARINLEGARQQIYSAGQCFHCTVVNCITNCSCLVFLYNGAWVLFAWYCCWVLCSGQFELSPLCSGLCDVQFSVV